MLPSWITALTGADKFANNPENGFAPTWGDALQGIGHSLMQHYRGQGGTYGGPTLFGGVNAAPGMGINGKLADILGPQINPGLPVDPRLGMKPMAPTGPQVNPGIPAQVGASSNWGSLQPLMGRFNVW